MKLLNYLFLLLLASTALQAQNIKVLNSISKEPVFGVAIYNLDKSKSVITNFRGEAELNQFFDDEVIYFKHLSHVLKKLTKLELDPFNKVYLVNFIGFLIKSASVLNPI